MTFPQPFSISGFPVSVGTLIFVAEACKKVKGAIIDLARLIFKQVESPYTIPVIIYIRDVSKVQ